MNNLTDQDYEQLEKSFIPREWADKAGLYRVTNGEGAEVVERRVRRGVSYAGIVFPYIAPGMDVPRIKRLRRDEPDYEEDARKSNGWREQRKYLIAAGCKNHLYYYRHVNPNWMRDASIPLFIVEGEKKTIAMQRFLEEIDQQGLVVGLPGVWGWRTVKTLLENEESRTVKGLLYDFDYLALDQREVFVIYDADARENKSIELARRRLVNQLRQRGAFARWLEMPDAATTGCKGIDDLLGAKGVQSVGDWLRDAMGMPNDEGYINISLLTVPDIIAKSWEAIQQNNAIPYLFQRRGQAYRLEEDDDGRKVLRELTTSKLRIELMNALIFLRNNKAGLSVPSDVPDKLPSDMLAVHPLPLPVIDRIISVPLFASDGELQITPGYNPKTRCYLAPPPDVEFMQLPDKITRADVAEAEELIEEMICEFPLIDASEVIDKNGIEIPKDAYFANRANAIAFMLLPFARGFIDGPTPIHAFNSNENGAGKTLLMQCLLFAYRLKFPDVMVVRDEATPTELQKQIDAQLISEADDILIDNLNHSLASGTVAGYASATEVSIREMGQNSKMTRVKVRQPIGITGKALEASNELSRRMSLINLITDESDPESRTGLKDLRQWTHNNRLRLVYAAHIMVGYWLQQGRPGPSSGGTLGSFEDWYRVIGGILDVCGIRGFQANRAKLKSSVNLDKEALNDFFSLWYARVKTKKAKAREMVDIAMTSWPYEIEGATDERRARHFSEQIRRERDRVFEIRVSPPSSEREIQWGTPSRPKSVIIGDQMDAILRVRFKIAGISKGSRDYQLEILNFLREVETGIDTTN